MGLAHSNRIHCYSDPGVLSEQSMNHLSRYVHQLTQNVTNRVQFRIKIVIWYLVFYNWAARCFWHLFHYMDDIGDFGEVVGSYAENSCIVGSDVDILQCLGRIFASEDNIEPERLRGLLVYTKDEAIPPGCCWLRTFRNTCETHVNADQYLDCDASGEIDGHTHYPYHNNMDKVICYRAAVCRGPDNMEYFASKIFSNYHGRKGLTEYGTINCCLPRWQSHGPAFSQTYFGFIDVDVALCLRCDNGWPESANEWTSRPRQYGWPSEEFIKDLVESGFDVVAIPSKITDGATADLEWRISFRMAETKLIKSLNETQRSCYILLKILVKQLISPMFPEEDFVSSYTMKTVIFWTLETTDPSVWQEENLLHCLQVCLDRFCEYVQDGYCPSYFIPSYNLFRTKLAAMNEVGFQERIRRELEPGWLTILRCDFFRDLSETWTRAEYREEYFIKSIKMKIK